MIVRNEAKFLPHCLRSVRDIVDEIIVVDTGSSDGSPKIARELGARVYEHEWNDDFSSARNRSIELARGRWILVLDADEIIAERDKRAIAALLNGRAAGHLFTYRSYSNDSRDVRWVSNDGSYAEGNGWDGWIAGQVVRLFRRDTRIRFEGAVHETVDSSIRRCGGKIAATGIIIHHFHEKKGKEKLREKQLQYLRLCERSLRVQAPSAKVFFDMGLIRRHILNDLRGAAALHEQALEVDPDHVDARIELALLCHLRQDAAGAAEHLAKIFEKAPENAPAWFLCGIILEQRGKIDKAVHCYERALAANPHLVDARVNLGALWAKEGQYEKARKEWMMVYRLNPSNAKALLNLGALELREGKTEAAQQFFEKALASSPESAPLWNNLGVLHAGTGRLDQARQAFKRALALDPSREDISRNLAALNIQAGAARPSVST